MKFPREFRERRFSNESITFQRLPAACDIGAKKALSLRKARSENFEGRIVFDQTLAFKG